VRTKRERTKHGTEQTYGRCGCETDRVCCYGSMWDRVLRCSQCDTEIKRQSISHNRMSQQRVGRSPIDEPPLSGFSMGERTGSRVLQMMWSYVMDKGLITYHKLEAKVEVNVKVEIMDSH
jgi:hypothetical protein